MGCVTVAAFALSTREDCFAPSQDAASISTQKIRFKDKPYILFESYHSLHARKQLDGLLERCASVKMDKFIAESKPDFDAKLKSNIALADEKLPNVVHWKFCKLEDNGHEEYSVAKEKSVIPHVNRHVENAKRKLMRFIMKNPTAAQYSSKDEIRMSTLMHIQQV